MISRISESWATLKARYADLVAEYGYAAFGVWFSLFLVTFAGFYIAISQGIDPSGAASQAGTIGGAYLATQATKPARIMATLALTPVAVRVWHRFRPKTA